MKLTTEYDMSVEALPPADGMDAFLAKRWKKADDDLLLTAWYLANETVSTPYNI